MLGNLGDLIGKALSSIGRTPEEEKAIAEMDALDQKRSLACDVVIGIMENFAEPHEAAAKAVQCVDNIFAHYAEDQNLIANRLGMARKAKLENLTKLIEEATKMPDGPPLGDCFGPRDIGDPSQWMGCRVPKPRPIKRKGSKKK